MYQLHSDILFSIYVVFCVIIFEDVCGKGRSSNREASLWNKDDNKLNSAYGKEIFIDVDDRSQDGMGSGYGPYMNINTDDEDLLASGDGFGGDDDDAGSGYFSIHAQNCLLLRKQILAKGMRGVYLPECTKDGNFKRKQCHKSTNFCWCVDKQGREIENTRQRNPNHVQCDGPIVVPPIKRNKANSRNDEIIEVPQPPNDFENADDFNHEIVIEPTDDIPNHIDIMNSGGGGGVEVKPYDPEQNSVEMMQGADNFQTQSPAMMQPGMLAVVIGGTVVGLLCAVLLVMFIVYRMRKKDEGSYALEEPKRSPSLHMYSRAPTKEFYA